MHVTVLCKKMCQKLSAVHLQKKMPFTKYDIGQEGEHLTAQHLEAQGVRILQRNWRYQSFEIDIIAEDSQGILFVEVKTRKDNNMTSPLDGISYKKRRTLIKAAQVWLTRHSAWHKSSRFVVAAVTYKNAHNPLTYTVVIYDNAFDSSPFTTHSSSVDSCHSSWQPW